MGNSHEFHNMSLFLWQWGVICAVLPYINIVPYKNSIIAIWQFAAFYYAKRPVVHDKFNTLCI